MSSRRLIGRARRVRSSRAAVRWLFLRALGAVYLIAFTSLRVQVLGLYGSRGIRPIRELLAALRAQAGRRAYQLAPSLLWLGSSDRDLVRLCRAGQISSLGLLLGVAPGPMNAASWALYLSFVTVGQEFLSFQWDGLLLETGLHATLVASTRPGRGARAGQPPRLGSILMRWLVFRLHFQSGFVKLESQDQTWRRCTACAYHYETQPLPTRLGWYVHHLPRRIHRVSTAVALAVELGAPWLAFAPRRARKLGFSALAGLQALIAATGNYAFFNLLTVALAIWTLDDGSFPLLQRLARIVRRPAGRRRGALARACGRIAYGALATLLAIASAVKLPLICGPPPPDAPRGPEPVHRSPSLRERVRPVRRDDDLPARDRGRRIERWRGVARILFRYKPRVSRTRQARLRPTSRAWIGRCGSQRSGPRRPGSSRSSRACSKGRRTC